jgi:hypothetical protein
MGDPPAAEQAIGRWCRLKSRKLNCGPNGPVFKVEMLTFKDVPEYDRIRNGLVETLKRLGCYEPAIDDLHIDAIARATIYTRRLEMFLDSENATEEVYTHVSDAQVKFNKIVENAVHGLAIARRERLSRQAQKAAQDELRKAILEAIQNATR